MLKQPRCSQLVVVRILTDTTAIASACSGSSGSAITFAMIVAS